jgi:hypothetical protein
LLTPLLPAQASEAPPEQFLKQEPLDAAERPPLLHNTLTEPEWVAVKNATSLVSPDGIAGTGALQVLPVLVSVKENSPAAHSEQKSAGKPGSTQVLR